MDLENKVTCVDKKLFGLTVNKGCDWTGERWQLEEREFRTDQDSWRALAGREGIKLLCPNCGNEIDEIITRMS